MLEDTYDLINTLLGGHVVAILTIIIVTYLVTIVAVLISEKLIRRTVSHRGKVMSKKEQQQREDTLISTTTTTIRIVFAIVALFMILGEVGVNIGPLLAGAGVVGVALGFGAQSMVKDYLAGFFIIAENQYRVGDVLQVNQTVAGIVESVTLRATVLRDLSGMVHHIPNGQINIATNMTMEYANVDLNVGVGYESDIDNVEKIINQVGEEIYSDEAWKDVALEAPHMMRVDEFADSAIIVKIVCKTAPIRQWDVKSEILRRIKKAFDAEGIVIPYPQRVVHSQDTNSQPSNKK